MHVLTVIVIAKLRTKLQLIIIIFRFDTDLILNSVDKPRTYSYVVFSAFASVQNRLHSLLEALYMSLR